MISLGYDDVMATCHAGSRTMLSKYSLDSSKYFVMYNRKHVIWNCYVRSNIFKIVHVCIFMKMLNYYNISCFSDTTTVWKKLNILELSRSKRTKLQAEHFRVEQSCTHSSYEHPGSWQTNIRHTKCHKWQRGYTFIIFIFITFCAKIRL